MPMKKRSEATQTLRAGCSKAEPKTFDPLQTPFPEARDGQNLISWRWSLHLPTDQVWWGSMHAISSYRGNSLTNTHTHTHTPTNKQTNKQTHRQYRLQYTAPPLSLARSVTSVFHWRDDGVLVCEWRDAVGRFPDYPSEEEGGSLMIFKDKDPAEVEAALKALVSSVIFHHYFHFHFLFNRLIFLTFAANFLIN